MHKIRHNSVGLYCGQPGRQWSVRALWESLPFVCEHHFLFGTLIHTRGLVARVFGSQLKVLGETTLTLTHCAQPPLFAI